jgi:hypothetical protein
VNRRPSRTRVPADFDRDPGRVRLAREAVHWHALVWDIHEPVARRLPREALTPVLDVGCGRGGAASASGRLGRIRQLAGDAFARAGPDAKRRLLRASIPHASLASVALPYVL